MKRIIAAVRDESRPVQERLFILLASLALTAIAAVAIVGLFIGETIPDIIMLASGFFIFLILVIYAVKKKKISLVANIIAAIIIFLLMPLTFFTGGGIYGGTPLWFLFCSLFLSLIVYGKAKYIFLVLEAIVAGICYLVGYSFPELQMEHSVETAYLDSYVSMVFVGAMLSLMVGFEIRVLRKETERSDEKSRQIEELSKSRSRFFSSMSHEIRTPINTIIGLNEMILREDISDEVAEDARNIRSASNMLLSLINDILDMSKMESGRMEMIPVVYDVGRMLSEIVNMIWVRAQEKGLEFTIDVDPSLPAQLLSDDVRIKQILINLLNNAVKYTELGSVNLSVHCRRTGENRALVTYSVEDTGMGIRKESIPHLFDAFRRADSDKNRYIEGTGLGLSIVKQLVELLGGEISVSSIYTQGSTFTVSIEQETVDEREIGRFTLDSLLHGAGARTRYRESFEAPNAHILIVDDNSANLLVAVKLLRATKVKTDTASSGAECLKKTMETHYDAILMDHMMPGMDGIECFHAIREQSGGSCRETPVIILTANADSESQALYRREGFDAYLLKPIDHELLEETLLEMLPPDLVDIKGGGVTRYDPSGLVREARRKLPLLITTDTVADLPKSLRQKLNIPVIPYKVYTGTGVFDDETETDGEVLVRSMRESGLSVRSGAPSVEDYEEFFAKQLSRAQHILHISMGKHISEGFANASEAALAFYNVSVLDSEQLSGGTGLMVLAAKALADGDHPLGTEEITAQLKAMSGRIQTSFILDSTSYLCRSGRLSESVNRLCAAFSAHPVMVMKEGGLNVGRIYFGNLRSARMRYVRRALRSPAGIDTSTLFLTCVGLKHEEIEDIKREVGRIVDFDNIYVQKASPAVSANCGPGTFGLLFARK